MYKCKCGCGKEIEIKAHHKYSGIPKFIKGHNSRVKEYTGGQFHKGVDPWNKGLKDIYSDKTLKKISDGAKGRPPWNKGIPFSEETKKKMSEAKKGENHCRWTGGCDAYYHNLAKEKFYLDYCEICFITEQQHIEKYNRKFDMHCTSNPKDYTLMTVDNWKCVCIPCHKKIEKEIRNGNGYNIKRRK